MCPVRELQHDLELEQQRRTIECYSVRDARDMCRRLAELVQHQELIIRAATQRIAELEAREALQDRNRTE